MWIADTNSADQRAAWRANLDALAARQPAVVVAGHLTPDAATDAPIAYATRTISPLDALLHGAIEAREKTYSVPLAYWSFQREPAVVDGREVRLFPRLIHGGAHLQDPERDWKPDLFTRSLQGLLWGLIAALALTAAVAGLRRRRAGGWRRSLLQIARNDTEAPWRAMLLTAAAIAAFVGWLVAVWPVYHPFGTDRTGNDVLYQALKSVRTAVVIGSLSTIATLPLAIALGVLAGYFKGRVDDAIQYFYTVLSAIPPILLVVAFVLLINVYIDATRVVRHRSRARRVAPFPAVCDPRDHRLGHAVSVVLRARR
jgi:peptide/nickel transport system permease protein